MVGKEKVNQSEKDYLRTTIQGKAGSGKSTFIKTLMTLLRIMFEYQSVVLVSASTSNDAFDSGGKAINRAFICVIGITFQNLSAKSEEKLLKKLKTTLLLIFSEWSLISTKPLAEAENHIS